MSRMDANRDGVIQWDEFLAALGEWIADGDSDISAAIAATPPRPGGKRKNAPSSPQVSETQHWSTPHPCRTQSRRL